LPTTSSSLFSAFPIRVATSTSTSSTAAAALGELERLVSSGAMAVAFALYPTQMSDLIAVADGGAVMPPKSILPPLLDQAARLSRDRRASVPSPNTPARRTSPRRTDHPRDNKRPCQMLEIQ
jgi:hypothetical protein